MWELKSVWRHSTIIIPSLISSRQSIAASIQKLPDSLVKSFSRARHTVGVSGETIRFSISLSLAVDFLHVTYMKDEEMLVFNFIFGLLWTGEDSSVSSVAFLGFRVLK